MTQSPGNFHSSGIRGIVEWQFVIPQGSGKLKPIPRVSGSGFGEFRGVFCFRFEVNLNLLNSNHLGTGRGKLAGDLGERVPRVPRGIPTQNI